MQNNYSWTTLNSSDRCFKQWKMPFRKVMLGFDTNLMGDFLSLRKGLKDAKQVQKKLLTKASSMALTHDS